MSVDVKPPTVDSPRASSWQRVHLWQIQSVRDLLVLAGFIGLIYLGYLLSVVTVPLLVALALAYIIDPLVGWLADRVSWLGRRGAVLAIMGVLGVSLVVTLIVTVPMVVRQTGQLMRNTDRYIDRARDFASDKNLPSWVQEGLGTLTDFLPARQVTVVETVVDVVDDAVAVIQGKEPASTSGPVPAKPEGEKEAPPPPPPLTTPPLDEKKVRELIREELAKQAAAKPVPAGAAAPVENRDSAPDSGTLSTVATGSVQVLAFLRDLVGGLAHLAIFTFISVFCFYFFSVSFPGVKSSITTFFPPSNRHRMLGLAHKMDHAISGFVRGRLTICFVMGIIYATGWTLCGVPHAVLLGLAIGICGLVPYLSAIGLPIAWALLAVSLSTDAEPGGFYFSGEGAAATISWWKVLLFPALVNAVAQGMEDYVLNPMIQGKATNLHPATILLACIAGGSLAGLYGLMLAIPVTACVKILMDEVMLPRLRQWLAGRKEDPLPL
jgi:predicted PurR-regulated permease PerM